MPDQQDTLAYLTPKQRAAVEANPDQYVWVVSGRADDRGVIFAKEKIHPGGELFVGGYHMSQPAARTADVMQLLNDRYLIDVGEPGVCLDRPTVFEDQLQPTARPTTDDRLFAPVGDDQITVNVEDRGGKRVAVVERAEPGRLRSTRNQPVQEQARNAQQRQQARPEGEKPKE